MTQGISVMLSEDQSNALKHEVYTMVMDQVEKARRDVGLDRQYLKRKDAIVFAGVSGSSFDAWNIPSHVISEGITLYAKKDILEFIESH